VQKWSKFKKMPQLMLTPSADYPAYGRGGKLLNRTYKPTPTHSLITRQQEEVTRLKTQLLKAEQDLTTLNEVRFSLCHSTISLYPPQPRPSLLPRTSHCCPPRCTCRHT
jgi:hypothetical protein